MKKKVFSILLIIVLMMSMLIGLTACGDEDDDDDERKSSKSEVSVEDEEDEDEIDFSDELMSDSGLKRAENAKANTELSLAKEAIEVAVSEIQTDFVIIWTNDPTASISDYITISMLDEKLQERGYYKLCTSTSAKTSPSNKTSSAVGTVYFTRLDGDGTIYEAEILPSGSTYLKVENVTVVD